ncbi:DUF4055 domain-containing protein [Sodalis sp. RH16]|uniref:DUF4055 domain-containing protein n=1 Tax=Sodalis sp. RH16 TaxID=3394331 RepID=UPI0039B5A5C9
MADISTPIKAYSCMVDDWDLIDALMGGTKGMRGAGEKYLPRWPNEDIDAYKCRLKVATLLPALEETIKGMNGRVFADETTLSADTPDDIKFYAENFDLAGNNLDVWAQQFFNKAMERGLCHALVDYPRIEGVSNLAQEKAVGARPYAIIIDPRQLIGWKSARTAKGETLTEIRIMECVTVPDGEWGEKEVLQIRLLRPNYCALYQKQQDANNQAVWALTDEWATTMDTIPLVTLYTKRTGFMTASPPLLNLAHLNVKHWQSQSDQDTILHVARVPILSVFGLADDQELTLGASTAMKFNDRTKQGVEYTEHTGASIDAGQASLDDLLDQMRMAGAKLLRKENTSTKSVDQVGQETMQEDSPLYTMANSLEDALDNVLQFMADWRGMDDGGNVEIHTELDMSSLSVDAPGVTALVSAYQAGAIRKVDLVRDLQTLGLIDADADVDEVIAELAASVPGMGAYTNGPVTA